MRLRRNLLEMIAGWDTPTRLSLTVAVLLLAAMLALWQWGGESYRTPAIVSVLTLFTVIELIVLWGNRRMVTPFTVAQRYYQQGAFDRVVAVLAPRVADESAKVDELTLLGNTYRQLGDLSESERVLFKAVNISSDSYFPLYGFGRTLLVKGDYEHAAEVLEQALALGAPPATRVDLAEAYYRQGMIPAARTALGATTVGVEPQREFMRQLILGRVPPTEILEQALPYWQETAQRFRETPYGAALQAELLGITTQAKGKT